MADDLIHPPPDIGTSALAGISMTAIDTDPEANVVLAVNGALQFGWELLGVLPFRTRAGRAAFLVITRKSAS